MTEQIMARAGSLKPRHDVAIQWRYVVPAGDTLQTCLQPNYFRHALKELGASQIKGVNAFNTVEIIAEDGSWEADLRVLDVDLELELVKFRLLHFWQDETVEKPLPDGYEIEFVRGNGWRAFNPRREQLIGGASIRAQAFDAALADVDKPRLDG